jgi:hypothetical protein
MDANTNNVETERGRAAGFLTRNAKRFTQGTS